MTNEELKIKSDRLWDCWNGMRIYFGNFAQHVNTVSGISLVGDCNGSMVGNVANGYLKEAEKALVAIEEAIKKYRETEPKFNTEVIEKVYSKCPDVEVK